MPSDSRSEILIIAKGFPPTLGGLETYSEQVARAYLRAGFDVRVMTQTDECRGLDVRETPDGLLRVWNAGAGGQAAVSLRMLLEAFRFRKVSRPSLVHSTTWRVGVVAQIVFADVPRVVTAHGRELMNFPHVAGPAMRWVLRRAALVIAISGETKKVAASVMRKAPITNLVVSHNGLTDRSESTRVQVREARRRTQILSMCRLVPRKNVERTVLALSSLGEDVLADVELRIAGLGPEAPRIANLIKERGLTSSVTLLGYVPEDEVAGLYDWADIFVHPHSHVGQGNDFEGFGIAIADAMAHGCAIISGRDGGPRDFVRHGETGLLVDGNDTDAVANALRQLIDEPELRQSLGLAGRGYAREHFSWDRHIRPVTSLIEVGEEPS